LPATISGLVVYLTFLIAYFAMDPKAMLSLWGWVFRIALITALANAIRSAASERRYQEMERRRREKAAAEAAEQEGEGGEEGEIQEQRA
jgi:hypothetical protein